MHRNSISHRKLCLPKNCNWINAFLTRWEFIYFDDFIYLYLNQSNAAISKFQSLLCTLLLILKYVFITDCFFVTHKVQHLISETHSCKADEEKWCYRNGVTKITLKVKLYDPTILNANTNRKISYSYYNWMFEKLYHSSLGIFHIFRKTNILLAYLAIFSFYIHIRQLSLK